MPGGQRESWSTQHVALGANIQHFERSTKYLERALSSSYKALGTWGLVCRAGLHRAQARRAAACSSVQGQVLSAAIRALGSSVSREIHPPNVSERPVAACRVRWKRTFADFAERKSDGRAAWTLTPRVKAWLLFAMFSSPRAPQLLQRRRRVTSDDRQLAGCR